MTVEYRMDRRAAIAAVLLFAIGCGSREGQSDRQSAADRSVPATSPAERSRRPRVVVLGDSLTAGLGLAPDQAYPVVLQQRVDAARLGYEVVNAGVSADTSAGGLRRLDWSIHDNVRVLIVALGANDGLRGLPVDELRANLSEIIRRAQARGIVVILAGMEAPPNFGPSYTTEFRRVYPSLAKEYGVALIPFLLQGVAGIEWLNQSDGLHPTAAGARIVADNVWDVLKSALKAPPADPKSRTES